MHAGGLKGGVAGSQVVHVVGFEQNMQGETQDWHSLVLPDEYNP
jgi:hypothetical protein